jgi:hypothetical protein
VITDSLKARVASQAVDRRYAGSVGDRQVNARADEVNTGSARVAGV